MSSRLSLGSTRIGRPDHRGLSSGRRVATERDGARHRWAGSSDMNDGTLDRHAEPPSWEIRMTETAHDRSPRWSLTVTSVVGPIGPRPAIRLVLIDRAKRSPSVKYASSRSGFSPSFAGEICLSSSRRERTSRVRLDIRPAVVVSTFGRTSLVVHECGEECAHIARLWARNAQHLSD